MATAHTPGPWVCHPTSNWSHNYLIDRPDSWMPFEGNEVARANARLISKAPDMLALCQQALRALDENSYPLLRQELRNIIQQATGEHHDRSMP